MDAVTLLDMEIENLENSQQTHGVFTEFSNPLHCVINYVLLTNFRHTEYVVFAMCGLNII